MAWLQAIFNLSSDSIGAEAYWAFVLVTCQDTESRTVLQQYTTEAYYFAANTSTGAQALCRL
jgi:hypothetical protein